MVGICILQRLFILEVMCKRTTIKEEQIDILMISISQKKYDTTDIWGRPAMFFNVLGGTKGSQINKGWNINNNTRLNRISLTVEPGLHYIILFIKFDFIFVVVCWLTCNWFRDFYQFIQCKTNLSICATLALLLFHLCITLLSLINMGFHEMSQWSPCM